MSKVILKLENINKTFPGTKALDNVSVSLAEGEILAIIGENGAGKSTLMKVLMGLYKSDSGEIYLDDEHVEIQSPYHALQIGIGMVPQELNLIPELTVAENIFLGHEIKKNGLSTIDWKKTRIEAKHFLEQLNADININENVSNLSAALQQIVSIARLLAHGSRILILDEPTASLTKNESESLFETIELLQKQGKSVIYISHHLEEIKRLCHRVVIMRDGSVVTEDQVDNISINEMIFAMTNRVIDQGTKQVRKYGDETVLEVNNYSRSGEFKNISFKLQKGEILGIAGLVGSGRTELIETIYGLKKPDEGTLKLYGEEVNFKDTYQALNNGLGLVPEERRSHGVFPVLSVSDNLIMPSLRQNSHSGFIINYSKVKKIVEELIEKLFIKTPTDRTPILNLSGGNQQKVIIARWIAQGAKILFLDEPTRGIDVNAKQEIYKLIFELADNGVSIVVISSELEEVIKLSDRIMVMFNGQKKGIIESVQNVTEDDILSVALN